MGLLDNRIIETYVDGIVDLQDLHKVLEDKLGGKYQIKFLKKGNIGKQMTGGAAYDQILVAKNAYHRTLVTVTHITQHSGKEMDETSIGFNRDTLKWWLQAINNNVGFIGAGIIRLMYGSNKVFDNDILDALKTSYQLKNREQNVGLSLLWKKDNTKELQ